MCLLCSYPAAYSLAIKSQHFDGDAEIRTRSLSHSFLISFPQASYLKKIKKSIETTKASPVKPEALTLGLLCNLSVYLSLLRHCPRGHQSLRAAADLRARCHLRLQRPEHGGHGSPHLRGGRGSL